MGVSFFMEIWEDTTCLDSDYKFSDDLRDSILSELHPYIIELMKMENLTFESPFQLSQIYGVSYDGCAYYLLGKIAHEILEHNFVDKGIFTEEELKKFVFSSKGFFQKWILKFKKLDLNVSIERRQRICGALANIIDMYDFHLMENQNDSFVHLIRFSDILPLESYALCFMTVKGYYAFCDTSIEDFIENVVSPIIVSKRKEKLKGLSNYGK